MYVTDHIFACLLTASLLLTDHNIAAQNSLNMDNVAIHGQCNQSSNYTEDVISNQCNCAINGNTSSTFTEGDCSSKGNCIHTGENDNTPTWTVYLDQTYVIQRITVYGREHERSLNYGRLRMRNVVVSANQKEVYRFPYPQSPSKITDIDQRVSGGTLPVISRDVTLSRSDRLPNGTKIDLEDYRVYVLLNICEVQVWVCKVGHYGNEGTCIPCRPECQNSICDDIIYPNTCPEYDPCNARPCKNGGSCERVKGSNPHSFTCRCLAGYTGWNCSTEINECRPDPCVNGTCKDLVAGYNCTCHKGYSGVNCSIDINECQSQPCVRGHCQDLVNDFLCVCEDGYEGKTCNIFVKLQPSENALGSIVGAFLGGATLMACVLIFVFWCWKRRTNRRQNSAHPQGSILRSPLDSQSEKTSSDSTPVTLNHPEASSTNECTVIENNTYDKLNLYGNDDMLEGGAYTGLRFTKNIQNREFCDTNSINSYR